MSQPTPNKPIEFDVILAEKEFTIVFPPNNTKLSNIDYVREFLRWYKPQGAVHGSKNAR